MSRVSAVPLRWRVLALFAILFVLSISTSVGYLLNDQPAEISCNGLERADLTLIMLRNTSVFALLLMGYLTYGVLTLSLVALNGFIMGYLLRSRPFILTLKLIIPHAIFELTWLIIISYVSLIASYRLSKDHNPSSILRYKRSILLSYILLVIGAIIEWKITPYIACGW